MSSSTFRPHGLIRSPIEEALYHRAHIANVYSGLADPKEYETSALMEVILYSNVFTSHDNFIVNSQQPPATESDKKCDIVVRYLEQGTQKIRVLCFAECKRTRTSQPFSLKALETQAKDYSTLYLDSEAEMAYVYVSTMAGAHVRLWTINRGEAELVPFWGSSSPGNWNEYKDVGDDTAGQEIEYWFGQMKQFPPTPHASQSAHTYGTSSTINMSSQASAPGYQASSSGYQAFSSDYQAPASDYQTGSPSQSRESIMTGVDMGEQLGEQSDEDEDNQIEGSVKAQEAAEYYVVKVNRITHTFRSDEFVFKDKRGKLRSTTQNDWKKITYNGRSAWKHHKYVCTERLFH